MATQSQSIDGGIASLSINESEPNSTSTKARRPKRVLVIGGGPSGLVALRNLKERGQFDEVQLVERRDDVGGVWYLDDPKSSSISNADGGTPAALADPRWPSPAYPGLVGNVLPEFLSYSNYPFPPPPRAHQPFPTLTETYAYLKGFAAPLIAIGAIRLSVEVVAVEELSTSGWCVRMRDWRFGNSGKEFEELWDAVVVANGWYDVAVWPQTPGIDELRELGLASHAQTYRGTKGYEGKRCLVVGNANSSNDIAAQLRSVSALPIYQSIRLPAFPGFPSLFDEHIVMVAPVAKYVPTTPGTINVHLTDNTVLTDIDAVFFGTGYRPFPHFIHVRDPNKRGGSLVPLVSEATRSVGIPGLHKYILYAHNTTLAFIGAPMSFTPFTLADASSTWLALAWCGMLKYPDNVEDLLLYEKARVASIEEQKKETQDPTAFMNYMVLAAHEQAYARGLFDEVVAACPELEGVLAEWSDEQTKKREAMRPVKLDALKWARGRGSYGNVSVDGNLD